MDQQPEKRELRGLYKHVKIPVKVLDIVIVVCVLAIVVVLAIELQDPGYTITFDTKGGTDVPAQNQMYGEYLNMPEQPTREGYVFTGWFKDDACQDPWFEKIDTIQSDVTLYAGWEKKE
jgi:uncharacterized repeat protein (TIGR02543 family)